MQPILRLCARDMGYKEGGRRRDICWRQEAMEIQIRAILKEIPQEARMMQQVDRDTQ